MKKSLLFILPTLLLAACSSNNGGGSYTPIKDDDGTRTVLYMTNISGEDIGVPSEYIANGEDTLFDKKVFNKGDTITFPSETPTKPGYVFDAWCFDKESKNVCPFNYVVKTNLVLHASYVRETIEEDEYEEVKLTWKENINDSISSNLVVSKVLNRPVSDNKVELTTIGLRKLEENKSNVQECLIYTRKSTTNVNSFIYDPVTKNITISLENGGVNDSVSILVNDITNTLSISDSTYQNKALKYEQNADVDPYSIVLAGSSSMENWTTSKEDMSPLTTVNVGIGGTRVEHWEEKLAQRLVYPFSPRAVAFYLGINNIINNYNTGTETGEGLVRLFTNVHNALPDATVYFVMVNYVPGYMKFKNEIDNCNNVVSEFAKDNEYVRLIDAGRHLLKETGQPNHAYFLSDGLHMSSAGYVIWGGVVKQFIMNHEDSLYKK